MSMDEHLIRRHLALTQDPVKELGPHYLAEELENQPTT